MDLNYLKEFLLLSQTGNYRASAKELNISQASLTNHIKALEKELQVPLFNRNTRKVELSRYGAVFQEYAQQYVNLYEDCERVLSTKNYNEKIIITIAVEPHYEMGELLNIIRKYQEENSGYVIEFLNVPGSKGISLTKEGRCSLIFTPQDCKENPGFETVTIREERSVAIVRKDNPLAGNDFLNVEDLRGHDLFLPAERLEIYKMLIENCRLLGFEPEVACVGISELMGMMLSELGNDICIMPDYSAERKAPDDMKIIPLEPEMKWYVNLIYKNDPNNLAEGLWEYIKDNLDSLTGAYYGN